MALLQFFIINILVLGITSVTYSVPYEDIHLAFSSTPSLIYAASEFNPALSGYSYATQDFNGGESNVVFTTGADSVSRLRNKMKLTKMPERYSQGDISDGAQENLISSKQQTKPEEVEASINKQEDSNINIKVLKEEKKPSKNSEADNDFVEHQAPLQQIPFADVPYPAFKADLLNLPSVLPSYHISPNVIQNQYYPHNFYSHLELPLHNFDFYNPTVPLFYQAAVTISDDSIKHVSTTAEDLEFAELYGIKSLQTNATTSKSNSIKSNVIESRFSQESVTNATVKTSSKSAVSLNKLESTITTEKVEKEITSGESVNPVTTSQSSVEQTTENKASNIVTTTEVNLSTEKSNTTTSKRCTTCVNINN